MLVEAFCDVANDDARLHLLMAGPDRNGWASALQACAERKGCADRIHWPGILRGDAKWGAFYASEAFVLPSHQENFGIAVVEALACGTPVLLSNQVNLAADLLQDGCALIEPDTREGTRTLLQRWFASGPEERKAMSGRALDCFTRRFNLAETVRTIQGLFTEAGTAESATRQQHAGRPR